MILIGRGLDPKGFEKETKKRLRSEMCGIRVCSFQGVRSGSSEARRTSGGNGEGDPPVPIPNTEVKPLCADGTWLETARESRSLPDPIFLSSSMAEHSAVNRRVVGSSPTWGATKGHRY